MKLILIHVDLSFLGDSITDTYYYNKEGEGKITEILLDGEEVDTTDIHALLTVYNILINIKNEYEEATNTPSIFGALDISNIIGPIVDSCKKDIDDMLEDINDLMDAVRPTHVDEPEATTVSDKQYKQCYKIALRFMEEVVDPSREIPYEKYYAMVDALVKYNMWLINA